MLQVDEERAITSYQYTRVRKAARLLFAFVDRAQRQQKWEEECEACGRFVGTHVCELHMQGRKVAAEWYGEAIEAYKDTGLPQTFERAYYDEEPTDDAA
jgi:hypothetical protein